MLTALFSRVRNFIHEKTHWNPTDLPDLAIDHLCEISNSREDNSLEFGLYAYRRNLIDNGFELPPYRQMLQAAEKGKLKEFLKDSFNPNRIISIYEKGIDIDAMRLGYVNEFGKFCKYKDVKTAHEENLDEFSPEILKYIHQTYEVG